MAKRQWAILVLVLGILLALVSVFADPLGIGAEPRFGWKQIIGLLIGVLLVLVGLWRMRS